MITFKNMLKTSLPLALTLIAVMFMTSACGSKKTSKRVRPPATGGTPVNPQSPGCQGCDTSALILRTKSTYDSTSQNQALVITLDLLGQQNGQYDFNDPKVAIWYNGPLHAVGEAQINGSHFRLCYAPAGRYVLTSDIEPGEWQNTTVQRLRLIAKNGPTQLSLVFDRGSPNNPNTINKNEMNDMGGFVYVESVNGQPCGDYVRVY